MAWFQPQHVLVAGLCIVCTALIIAYRKFSETQGENQFPSRKACVFQSTTYHARLLPKESQHRFSYPTVNVGVDLESLEKRECDLGRWFAYNPKNWRSWSLWAISPKEYLDDITLSANQTRNEGILGRLRNILSKHGVSPAQLTSVFMVSMPSYVGFQGINPLVVHYCYSQSSTGGHDQLCVVVLEVHNTFGERHVYVLQVGKEEDRLTSDTFHHQWTFHRAFHVSPFNDRKGFYRVKIVDPFKTSQSQPYMHIHITMLEPDKRTKKLVASLYGYGQPLTKRSVLTASIKFPLALFLTTPRILAQAAALHWRKRLDVYPRPEPIIDGVDTAVRGASNEIKSGAIYWQSSTWAETVMQEHVIRSLQSAVDAKAAEGRRFRVTFKMPLATSTVTPTVQFQEDVYAANVHVTCLAPSYFTNLCIARHPDLVAHQTRQIAHAENAEVFRELMSGTRISMNWLDVVCWNIRHAYLRWSIGKSNWPKFAKMASEPSILDTGADLRYLAAILVTAVADVVGYTMYVLLRARFQAGTNPWRVWEREVVANNCKVTSL